MGEMGSSRSDECPVQGNLPLIVSSFPAWSHRQIFRLPNSQEVFFKDFSGFPKDISWKLSTYASWRRTFVTSRKLLTTMSLIRLYFEKVFINTSTYSNLCRQEYIYLIFCWSFCLFVFCFRIAKVYRITPLFEFR